MFIFRKIGSLDSRLLRRVVFFFIIIAVTISITSYLISGKATERALIEQMLHREQLASRAGSFAIKNYISSLGTSLVILGSHLEGDGVQTKSETIKNSLKAFLDNYSGTPVVSVLYVDELGEVKYLYQNGNFVEGNQVNISDRSYFSLAKEVVGDGYVVGIPIIPRSGVYTDRYLIPVASPIIVDGKFKGVVVASSDVSEVTRMYLNDLRISERSNIYLLGDQGVVLSAQTFSLVGMNVFDYTDQQKYPQKDFLVSAIKKDIENKNQKNEGKLDYFRNDYGDTSKTGRYLTTYNIINFEKNFESSGDRYGWILAIETPVEDAFLFTIPFFKNQFFTFLIFIFAILGLVFLGILTAKVQENEGYSKGFLRGRGQV